MSTIRKRTSPPEPVPPDSPPPVKPTKRKKPPAVDPALPNVDENITEIITTGEITPTPPTPPQPEPPRIAPELTPDAEEPPPSSTAPALSVRRLTLPAGTVQAKQPHVDQPFGVPWAKLAPLLPLYLASAARQNVDPLLGIAVGLIESNWTHLGADGRLLRSAPDDDGYAEGIQQLKRQYHEHAVPGYDFDELGGNIEIGMHLLAVWTEQTGSWQGAIRKYHPGTSPHGTTPESYVRAAAAIMAELQRAQSVIVIPPSAPPPLDPWRLYPFPKMVDVIVTKAYDGAGFDRVAPRGPRIVGSCNHITDGRGTIEWYSDFFSIGGERARDALTDLVIGRDGRIGLLNDWRDPNRGGTRAGWANGTANGIEGDGLAFYRRYPLINDVLVSKEHEGKAGEPMTAAQMAASIEISTAVAQSVKCPWSSYPYHPGLGGVNIEMMHYLFAPKSCPAEPFISTYYPILVREVKAKLKAWQGGIAGGPVPEPEPVWYTRFGFALNEIETFFGLMNRYNADGTIDELPFDKTGALSLLWLERCDREGKFPESERIWQADAKFVEGKELYASWVGGWTAYLALTESRASWRWLDAEAA